MEIPRILWMDGSNENIERKRDTNTNILIHMENCYKNQCFSLETNKTIVIYHRDNY